MRFIETDLPGAFVIELEERGDDRGFFGRAFCQREFGERGLETRVSQANFSHNLRRGTIRGFHYQEPPTAEVKLVRCIRGAMYNVIVDMRPHSPTYLSHFGVELTADNRRALYIPHLVAAGIQTLENETQLYYQVSEFYTPEAERGLRWDDPAIGVKWPLPMSVISEKDASWPLLERTSR